MHIITGLKKRCLGPVIAYAAATGEAPLVSAAKKPTVKEIRGAETQAEEKQEREQE